MICLTRGNGVRAFLAVLLAHAAMFFVVTPAFAQESETFQSAPLNPEFGRYQQKVQTSRAQNLTADGHGLGFIPSPVDLSHLSRLAAKPLGGLLYAVPGSYDLRTTGKLTAVRDQGTCGSCWTFGTMASLESGLLIAETRDLSENNLKNTSGFDQGACAGGNYIMSTAYLSRWSGPINEADDPYNAVSSSSPSGLTVQKHMQEVLFIPDRTGPTDNTNIKQAIMTYGAVATSMFMSSSSVTYYKAANYAYYDNTTETSNNHGVTIVGWNDSYSSSKFAITPPGNGAFIVKNSWGAGWGESGYFYVSYYDMNFGKTSVVFNDAEPTANYRGMYQYDPLGMSSAYGTGSTDTEWMANVFTAQANAKVTAAGFYALAPSTTYIVYVYTNVASLPTSGTLTGGSTSGTIASAGYHTITLSTPVAITAGQKFSVVVRLTTPGYNYPVAVEKPRAGYNSLATAGAGQSYLGGSTGSSWTDMTTVAADTNVCLKVFTSAAVPTVTTTAITGIATTTATGGGTITTDGGSSITARGICWSTAADPTTADIHTNDGTGTGAFTSSLSGLTPGTTYHVRAYAVNSEGTAYGSDVQFITNGMPVLSLPTVGNYTPDGICTSIASVAGIVFSDGGSEVTARGICWSTAANPTLADTCTNDGTGTGIFTGALTGLTPLTTYYVRAYATNSVGTQYGTGEPFTTLGAPVLPTVLTGPVVEITRTTASGRGTVTSYGCSAVTAKGICWSLGADPTTADICTDEGAGMAAFTSFITGLTPSTTYHVRAYAGSAVGTAYGDDLTFTTGLRPKPPTLHPVR